MFKREILAPELGTMTDADWQNWATEVRAIADLAKQSTNRNVARSGEDLTFAISAFPRVVVIEEAAQLRDTCDQVDYINLPGR